MITTKQLRYFDALARTEHFGRAAELCAVTQPALSMQIQELEADLGSQLVERRGKTIALTVAGREIAELARKILADISELESVAKGRDSPLRFGVIPTIAPYLLPKLFGAIAAGRGVSSPLRIREAQTAVLLDELHDGTLDVVMLALPVPPEVESVRLFDDPFYLIAPPNEFLTDPDLIETDRLKDMRILLLEDGHCLRDQALSFCNSRQILNIDTFGATNLSTLVHMVAAGMGCTLLPRLGLATETSRAAVRVLGFGAPEPRRTVGLAWRKSSHRSRDFQALGDAIVATLESGS